MVILSANIHALTVGRIISATLKRIRKGSGSTRKEMQGALSQGYDQIEEFPYLTDVQRHGW